MVMCCSLDTVARQAKPDYDNVKGFLEQHMPGRCILKVYPAALGAGAALALAQQQAGGRHPHVGEVDLGVAVGGVVVAEDGEHALDLDARPIHGHQDHGVAAVPRGVVVAGDAHEGIA